MKSENKKFIQEIESRTESIIDFIEQGLAANPKFDDSQSVRFISLKEQAINTFENAKILAIKTATL